MVDRFFSRFAHFSTYRLEYTEERQLKGQYQRNWTQSIDTAIVGPGKLYRFEHQGQMGSGLQVSDGRPDGCVPGLWWQDNRYGVLLLPLCVFNRLN